MSNLSKRDKIIVGSVAAGVVLFGGYALGNNGRDAIPSTTDTTTPAIIETVAEVSTELITAETTIVITSIQETKPPKTEPEKTKPPEIQAPATATAAPEPVATQAPVKENYVYVAASGNGARYHSNPNCSGMNGEVIKMTKEQAEAQGLTPCQKKKCYG